MICVIALIVFGILGIFSAAYRKLAKEAFDCVFRRITFRKCEASFDKKMKAKITGKLMRKTPKFAGFIYKYFEVFSWTLLILMLVSLFFIGLGVYNYAMYGNCNGKDSNQFCIFDPLGTNKPHEPGQCTIPTNNTMQKTLTPPPLRDSPYLGNTSATVVIIEFGCYECHYTKQAEATVKKIIQKYNNKIMYVYKDFPLSPEHINAIRASEAAYCALDQNKYWEYREYLFANQQSLLPENLMGYADELNLNSTQFKECLDSEKYKPLVEQNYNDGLDSGITVTPTFFINSKTIVGAEDYSKFNSIIRNELGIKWWEFWK